MPSSSSVRLFWSGNSAVHNFYVKNKIFEVKIDLKISRSIVMLYAWRTHNNKTGFCFIYFFSLQSERASKWNSYFLKNYFGSVGLVKETNLIDINNFVRKGLSEIGNVKADFSTERENELSIFQS